MYTKFATITLNTEKRGQNPTQVFVAQPTPTQENLAGRLFILLEVEAKKNDAQKIINFLIDDINENYYQNDKLSLREKIDTLKIESIFETVLVKVNRNLLDFLAQEKITIAPQNINATIGIVYKNQLHFANVGKNKALLLYKEEADIEYRMINVERNQASKEEPSLKKLFSSIISGDMPNKSYFIFTNESLSEYLFNKELIDVITKLAPLGAAEQIKNTLAKINTYIPFLGIIIKNNQNPTEDQEIFYSTPEIKHQPNYTPTTYSPALEQDINSTAEKTEQILASSSPIVSSQKISGLCSALAKKSNPFPALGKFMKALKKRAADKPEINNQVSGLDKNILLAPTPKRSRTTKALLIVLEICVLLFLGNLLFKKNQNTKVEVAEKNKTQEDIIKQKENQAESCKLYNDEACIKEKVKELTDIFTALSDDDKQQIADYEVLLAKFNELAGQTQHITKVENLKEVANFQALSADAQPENIRIINSGGEKKIYAADNNKKTIYKINLKTNVSALLTSDKITTSLNYPVINKDGTIYYLDNKQIVQVNPGNDQLNLINFNYNDQQNIVGIATYNGRLYALDKAGNQLYRYTLINNVFDKGESRLKDKADFSQIASFAIDTTGTQSDVYFLKTTGEVNKFYDGLQQNFKLDAVDPTFQNASKIAVVKNIYILEPANKRLVVFDKNGKFIKQYQSDKLTNPKDFFIDEAGKKAYFLNDSLVYEIDL